MVIGLIGVALGAAQVYYVGPLAKLVNPPYGMDIGFELGIVLAAIAYLLLRPIELRQTGR
jgi:purine-cytosine permease-like protein